MEALDMSAQPMIRPYAPGDESFVYSSWLKSYWDGYAAYISAMSPQTYWVEQRRLIARLFALPNTVVTVLASSTEPDVIVGWVMTNGQTVHYLYVKDAFRQMGLARSLLAAVDLAPSALTYSHTTKRAEAILKKHRLATYNPWLVR